MPKIRESYYDFMLHLQDKKLYKNDSWKGGILRRGISTYLYNEPKRKEIINNFDRFFIFLVKETSKIKNFFNFANDKNNTDAD